MSELTTQTAGKVVWFNLPAEDTNRAREFYGRLFGWSFEPLDGPVEYHVANEGGGGIEHSERKGLLVYFGTDDIDASVARVRELGGASGEPEAIPGVGRYARCTDSEGNDFGLYEAEV